MNKYQIGFRTQQAGLKPADPLSQGNPIKNLPMKLSSPNWEYEATVCAGFRVQVLHGLHLLICRMRPRRMENSLFLPCPRTRYPRYSTTITGALVA